jgi:SAM-dependent methyltransferase
MNPDRTALEELAAAYEGLEDPTSFTDAASLARYRESLLARTAPQVDFLVGLMPRAAGVLEIGCGNGRLLIELTRRRTIESAFGIDVARSRICFARRWAADESCDGVAFEAGDALAYELPPGAFDAVVVLTGAFGYFEAAVPGSAARLAERLHKALRRPGLICLELYPHPEHRRLLEATGGIARIWNELPEDDPWRFYLSSISLDDSRQILTHEKTFIHRATGQVDTGRRERLYLYSHDAIAQLLAAAGFRDVETFEGWSHTPYEGGEIMVVTAEK